MNVTQKTYKAARMKQKLDRLEIALSLIGDDEKHPSGKLHLHQSKLPGFAGSLFEGGARFDDQGQLRNLGMRQSNSAQQTVELIVRRNSKRTSITEKVYSQGRSTRVATAVFNPQGQLKTFRNG